MVPLVHRQVDPLHATERAEVQHCCGTLRQAMSRPTVHDRRKYEKFALHLAGSRHAYSSLVPDRNKHAVEV